MEEVTHAEVLRARPDEGRTLVETVARLVDKKIGQRA